MSVRLSPGTLESMAGVFAPPRKYRLGSAGGKGKTAKGGGTVLALAVGSMLSSPKPQTGGYRPSGQTKAAFRSGNHAGASARAIRTAQRTSARSHEVVVRVTGRQNGGGHVLANFAYISRLGHGAEQEVPLYTSDGDILRDGRDMQVLAHDWHKWEMGDVARRQGATSISMILSMPKGTDPDALREAGLAFARDEFANRQWVAALHVDRDHPHLHLTVARRDDDGRRFHPARDDLFRYRQRFAEKLRDRGIEANATPARVRGIDPAHEHIGVKKMREKGQVPRLDQTRAARAETYRERGLPDPVNAVLAKQRSTVLQAYEKSIVELSASPSLADQLVADSLQKFVTSMPVIESNSLRAVRIDAERANAKASQSEHPDPSHDAGSSDALAAALARMNEGAERSGARLLAEALGKSEPSSPIETDGDRRPSDVSDRIQGIVDRARSAPRTDTERFVDDTVNKAVNTDRQRNQRELDRERDRERDKDRDGPGR